MSWRKLFSISISVLFVLLIVLLVTLIVTTVVTRKEQRRLAQETQQELALLTENLNMLFAATDRSAEALDSVRIELLETVDEQITGVAENVERVELSSREQVLALEDQLSSYSGQIRRVVEEWSPRIVRLSCLSFRSREDDEIRNNGSGTLFRNNGQNIVLSNAHVLDNDDALNPRSSEECLVTFTSSNVEPYIVPGNLIMIEDSEGDDLGQALLGEPPQIPVLDLSAPICTHQAAVGDQIVVLGYPTIGAQESITVTEGVISGFEEDFYVTSADIGQGSSGGAAIAVQENCYLGTPTFTRIDRTGSLGRILKIEEL